MKITSYKRDLLRIALPIMLNNLVSQIQTLIDRVFLGRLGVTYMSAVGNANAPMWTTMCVLFALTTGATILISQSMGAKEDEKAKQYTASMFKYNSLFSMILFALWFFGAPYIYKAMGVTGSVLEPCLTYTRFFIPVFLIAGVNSACSSLLQTCGHTKPLVYSGIIRSGLNVILDYAMIFGHFGFPAMGVAGAALATTIAELSGLIVLIVIISKSKSLPTRPSLITIIKAKFTPYISAMKMGIPAAAEEFAWNFGNLMIIRLLNSINESAAGIYTIVFSIEVLPAVIFSALGNATLTLTGKETGKKDFVQAKKIGSTVFVWSMIIAAINLGVFLLIPKPLMSLFTTDSAIIASSTLYLLIVGLDLFPKAGNIVLGSSIRGYGDTKWMMYTQFFGTVFVVSVASLFIFVFKMGITGVFVAVICDELVRCLINYTRFARGAKKTPILNN